jgi:transglutaminase-like putative cysteine protease
MLIRLGYEIGLSCPQPTPLITILEVHPERQPDITWDNGVATSPATSSRVYLDQFGNQCTRYLAPGGEFTLRYDAIVEDSGKVDDADPSAEEVPVDELPDECLVYLLGSRYCETDHLGNIAWNLFGGLKPGWERVQAICDYVHNHLSFGYGYARSTRTASQAYEERVGVCRDFTHLAVALCRCMNIPARYVNGYLGDIGVPPDPAPMDFNAWLEVYLGGRWYTFDARHNIPRIGRVVVSRGRDATDVPLVHSFGPHQLTSFRVWTEEHVAEAARQQHAEHTDLSMRWHNPVTQQHSQLAS